MASQSVPYSPAHLAENVAADEHVIGVVDGGNPQPQHIGTVGWLLLLVLAALYHAPWINHIPNGLAHLDPSFIQHEAVGELQGDMSCEAAG